MFDGRFYNLGRAAYRNRSRRNRSGDDGTGSDGRACSDVRHHDSAGADPAIAPDADFFENAILRTQDVSGLVPRMLMTPAENLYSGCDLRVFSYDGFPYDAVAADVYAGTQAGCGMREKRPKLDAAG